MKSNGPRTEPWGTPHIIFGNSVLPCQFYCLFYTQCIDYGLIDNFETKTDFFLSFHNSVTFLVKWNDLQYQKVWTGQWKIVQDNYYH